MMSKKLIFLLFFCFVITLVRPVSASWVLIKDPVTFATKCPVIISGTLSRIDDAKGSDRSSDITYLKIAAIHKNVLSDVPLKIGNEIKISMPSAYEATSNSWAIRYPVGTTGTWLLMLHAGGEVFDACMRRFQFQPPIRDVNGAKVFWGSKTFPSVSAPPATYTQATWLQRISAEELEDDAANKRRAEELVRNMVLKGSPTKESLAPIFAAPMSAKSPILNMDLKEFGLSEAECVTFFSLLLTYDEESNIRSRAAVRLGSPQNYQQSLPLLRKALQDPSEDVKVFTCQAFWQLSDASLFKCDEATFSAILKLLADESREVRLTAVRALGSFNDPRAIAPITKLYHRESRKPNRDWYFSNALARLGEEKIALEAAQSSLKSLSWGLRLWGGVEPLSFIKSDKVVPILIKALVPELKRTTEEMKGQHQSNQTLIAMCQLLQQRTGQAFGDDVLQWHRWWERQKSKNPVIRPLPNEAELLLLQQEYWKLERPDFNRAISKYINPEVAK